MRDVLSTPQRRLYGRPAGPGTLVVWRDVHGAEQVRQWPNALPGHRTSCRIDSGKGLRQHRCSRSHVDLVDGYRAWREHEYEQAEAATQQYDSELAAYWREHERPTFRAYLTGRAS